MNDEFLKKYYEVAEELNKELKHHPADKIREQDTYGITKELIEFLSGYEGQNISRITVECNPSLTDYLESNNVYFKKMQEVLPFLLEIKGNPDLPSRNEEDHHIFVAGDIDYKT